MLHCYQVYIYQVFTTKPDMELCIILQQAEISNRKASTTFPLAKFYKAVLFAVLRKSAKTLSEL